MHYCEPCLRRREGVFFLVVVEEKEKEDETLRVPIPIYLYPQTISVHNEVIHYEADIQLISAYPRTVNTVTIFIPAYPGIEHLVTSRNSVSLGPMRVDIFRWFL